MPLTARHSAALLGGLLGLAILLITSGDAARGASSKHRPLYLALGDSVTFGYQEPQVQRSPSSGRSERPA